MSQTLTPEDIKLIEAALPTMSPDEKRKTLELLKTYNSQLHQTAAKSSFLDFIHHVYPGYKVGAHHRHLARIFEEIAEGKKKRVIVNIAPRHGKSEMISYLAPAWFLGKYPQKKIIMSSHTADLAVNFGRRVRNLVGSAAYKDIFPEVELQADSKSASRWGTNFQGEYFAIGVGGALAGRGADLFIIDDPHSEQEAKQGKPEVFLPAWEWFQSGPIQRLMPGGAIIIVMCMTGDTRVLMEDGTEKRLDQIKTGDYVATYDDGVLATAKVLNHQSNGVDSVYTIYTQSGRILQANERHPFLVEARGERKWKRLSELKTGDMLVVLKDAEDRQDRSVSPDCAPHVKQRKVTTKNIQTPHIIPQGITGNGKINFVRGVIAKNLRKSKDTVKGITTPFCIGSNKRPENHILQRIGEISGSKVGTALHRLTLTIFYSSKAAFVRCVSSLLPRVIPAPIGTANYASTTITSLEKSEDCFATTVIWQSDMQNQKQQHLQWQNITDFTVDEIVAITPSGKAEVFDIQIERTENFIANGAVSHNTRWSKLDLTGQIINQMTRVDGGEDWEIVEFPAIIEKNGEEVPLWPEFWALEELKKKRDVLDIRYWNAQYMQQPTSEEGALIKREWWQMWDKEKPPDCEFIIMSLDAAQETNNRSDYNALTTWGVFLNEETDNYNIILLNAIKERLEFPDLKRRVLEEYKEWEPDAFIVEKKSNGAALYQELRRMGVPVGEFTPGKGNDKISRVNAVSDLFRSGIVWAPERRWAKEVIEECNDFPSGTNDDLVDSTTQALMRFRQGGFIRLPTDEQDELPEFKSSRQQRYYSL